MISDGLFTMFHHFPSKNHGGVQLFPSFPIFSHLSKRDSKANLGEFHRLGHRDGITPAVLQTGAIRQALHTAGHQDLGANTGLGHFEDLGKKEKQGGKHGKIH